MNEITFKPACRACLIGSFPVPSHEEAADLVAAHAPFVPSWAQLPALGERMIPQFSHGLPGVSISPEKVFVDTASEGFEGALLDFYEDYLAVSEAERVPEGSRFALSPSIAPGFFTFLDRLRSGALSPFAVKGQVTGPFTLATALTDQTGRALFYDERLNDCVAKFIALNARFQAETLSAFGKPVFVFLDEPGLAGFGSSALISISREAALACLSESINAVHAAGGLCGIHVCGNTDWSLVLESGIDIVNFDAFSYFDRFAAFADSIKAFAARGGVIAWGIAPTADLADIAAATEDSLHALWLSHLAALEGLGLDRCGLLDRSLISPACGLGSLPVESALKVLALTRDLSARIRRENGLS